MTRKTSISIGLILFSALIAIGAYAAWYSYNRGARIEQGKKCNEELTNPKQMTAPDGTLAVLYSLDTCAAIIVPPQLWDVIRGRMMFEGVPNRMKVNPYSFMDIMFGRYTIGPADVPPCQQSATTTDCSKILSPNPLLGPQAPVSTTTTATIDPTLHTQLQTDLQGITPYFVDSRSFDGKPLTPQEEKIKNDIVDILVAKEPNNREYYSQLWPRAIGKRYVLIAQPSADSYYDILIDSQTGESSFLQNGASYSTHYLPFERPQPATNGRQTVLYIGAQDIYTYTLDQASFTLVPGSKLSGSETYHSGRSDFKLEPDETHTDDSITISVFDSSQIVQNPNAPENAMQTMHKRIRDTTFSF